MMCKDPREDNLNQNTKPQGKNLQTHFCIFGRYKNQVISNFPFEKAYTIIITNKIFKDYKIFAVVNCLVKNYEQK